MLDCRVGTSFDWSLVVHAYGDPTTTNWALTQPYQAYTFADLPQARPSAGCGGLDTAAVSCKPYLPDDCLAANDMARLVSTAAYS